MLRAAVSLVVMAAPADLLLADGGGFHLSPVVYHFERKFKRLAEILAPKYQVFV
jgi:hypothetical protein